MRSAVLVAEPEPETREYLGRQLRDDGFDVLGAARRSEALELAETARPDVVLIGELELCLSLRRGEPGRSWDRNVPVIVLAPSSDPVERVRALDRGADDVIGRPFAYEELLARIRALLRRRLPASADTIVAGDLELDRPTRRVNVRGTAIFLSAKEFELVRSSRPSRTACSRKRSSSGRSGAIEHWVAREPWSRTRRACARSSASARTTASS
jgi:DNA-binding response OmpR family regulator